MDLQQGEKEEEKSIGTSIKKPSITIRKNFAKNHLEISGPQLRRFGKDIHYRWYNEKDYFLLPKPDLKHVALFFLCLLIPFLGGFQSDSFTWDNLNPFNFRGPQFIALFVFLSGVALVAAVFLRHTKRLKEDPLATSTNLSWQELAVLSGECDGIAKWF